MNINTTLPRLPYLAILLGLFALVGVWYSVVVPPYEAPDEIWHMAFVHHLVTEGELPVSEPNTTALWRQQGTQTPGYYLVAAALTAWVDQSDFPTLYAQTHPYAAIGGGPDPIKRAYFTHNPTPDFPWHGAVLALHLTRFYSIGLGMVTLWAVYQSLYTLLGNSQRATRTALLGTTLLAFIPQFVFISSMANNDNAINATAALLMWRLIKLLQAVGKGEVPDVRDVMWIGILVGIGLLSKVSGMWLVLIAVAVLGVAASQGLGWRWWLKRTVLVLGITFAISGWWFIRNQQLYQDPFASNIWFSNILLRENPATWRTLIYSEWESLDHSFWGLFGWFNVAYPTWLYRAFQGIELLILIGLGVWLWRKVRQGTFRTVLFGQRTATALLLAWLLCLIISWANFFRIAEAAQGRYFLPAAPTLALGMVLGLGAWRPTERAPRWFAWVVAAGLALLTVITPLWILQPAYAASPTLTTLPASATPLNATFGDAMHLIGYEVTPTSLAPSTPIDLTLYWEALRPIPDDYSISIKGFGRALTYETVAEDNSYPDAGRWATRYWREDGIVVDRWRIWMSGESITPTLAKLTVEVFLLDAATGAPQTPLPIMVDGVEVASPYNFGAVEVRSLLPAPPDADFTVRPIASTVAITDYTATFDFTWEVGNALEQEYQMLLHLVQDPTQPPLATGDAPPAEGFLPTSHWLAGDRIAEHATLPLPTTLPIGDYAVITGLYDMTTFERVAGEGDKRDWQLATLHWDGGTWKVVTP